MRRSGITVVETVVAIACMAMAATLVAQLAAWSLRERAEIDLRLATWEWAANVLETARSLPADELTQEWAAKQTLPSVLAERMLTPTVTVTVDAEKNLPRVKRVTVKVQWFFATAAKAPPVELTALFADQAAREAR